MTLFEGRGLWHCWIAVNVYFYRKTGGLLLAMAKKEKDAATPARWFIYSFFYSITYSSENNWSTANYFTQLKLFWHGILDIPLILFTLIHTTHINRLDLISVRAYRWEHLSPWTSFILDLTIVRAFGLLSFYLGDPWQAFDWIYRMTG